MALRYPLPYGFAKSQRVLLEQEGPRRTLWVSERTVWASLSEVRRLHAYDVIEEVDDAALDRRMAQA
jgi:general secretion pathway protein E